MTNVSALKRVYYGYLGWLFWFTYQTQWWQFAGFSISSLLKFLSLVLFFAAFGWSWSPSILALAFLLMLWIWISYWWVGRAGYLRFVADPAAIKLDDELSELADGERVEVYASGLYAVIDREETVLLRPSEYWRSPAGEHGVMVKQQGDKYLYQFFKAETLQSVRPGWLIFGKEPLPTLAITFWQTWGPEYDETTSTYMVGGGEVEKSKRKSRTIFFTFTETAVEKQVMQKLLADLAEGSSVTE